MTSVNFIGGEKGGVGKSVVARLLAQYFIDKGHKLIGFDTDRSHTSFTRFYAEYAAPVVVDTYEGLDHIAGVYEDEYEDGQRPDVIVDLAAQTAAPVARWVQDSDVVALMSELNVAFNLWHVADTGKDTVGLLDRLVSTYGPGPNYIVVKNQGRGSDFSLLDNSEALHKAKSLGARMVTLAQLHEATMFKIDRQDASFWAAVNTTSGPGALGLLERQRVKTWLRGVYASFDDLPLLG